MSKSKEYKKDRDRGGMGTDKETREGLAEKAAREIRPNDNKDMAMGRAGVEGSWNIKEHVQRPCDGTEPGVFKKARVAGRD